MENTKTKRNIKTFFGALLLSSIVVLSGCSSSNLEKYGQENAYNKTSTGAIRHAPSNVTYYLDSSVTGTYKTAATYAISEANKLTDSVNISLTAKSNSDFVIAVEYNKNVSYAGYNITTASIDTGLITSSTIVLNAYYMSSYNLSSKKHAILHEIGHTFGLKDLENSNAKKYSVMYYQYSSNATYTFVTYQEFDKDNICWYYD